MRSEAFTAPAVTPSEADRASSGQAAAHEYGHRPPHRRFVPGRQVLGVSRAPDDASACSGTLHGRRAIHRQRRGPASGDVRRSPGRTVPTASSHHLRSPENTAPAAGSTAGRRSVSAPGSASVEPVLPVRPIGTHTCSARTSPCPRQPGHSSTRRSAMRTGVRAPAHQSRLVSVARSALAITAPPAAGYAVVEKVGPPGQSNPLPHPSLRGNKGGNFERRRRT